MSLLRASNKGVHQPSHPRSIQCPNYSLSVLNSIHSFYMHIIWIKLVADQTDLTHSWLETLKTVYLALRSNNYFLFYNHL